MHNPQWLCSFIFFVAHHWHPSLSILLNCIYIYNKTHSSPEPDVHYGIGTKPHNNNLSLKLKGFVSPQRLSLSLLINQICNCLTTKEASPPVPSSSICLCPSPKRGVHLEVIHMNKRTNDKPQWLIYLVPPSDESTSFQTKLHWIWTESITTVW